MFDATPTPAAEEAPAGAAAWVRPSGRAALLACAGLMLLFAVLSGSAAWQKSATTDENLHAPAAYVQWHDHDYRANPEHPPLWKYWCALPWLVAPPADARTNGPEFAAILQTGNLKWPWAHLMMYETPGNDPIRLIRLSRAMMLVLGVALGGVIGWWAWRAAGSVAAVAAMFLYALDPNFLAHAPLVCNDVCFTLAFVASLFALWRVGQKLTAGRVATLAVLAAAAAATKFSAVLLLPIGAILLAARALSPEPWQAARARAVTTRPRRLLAAACVLAACAAVSLAGIWASYGFQRTFAPDPAQSPDFDRKVRGAVANEFLGRNGRSPSEDEVNAARPGTYVRVAAWGLRHHVLPDPFLYGALTAYSSAQYHWSYLFGEVSGTGHWYYFPVAMAVKTPLATTLAGAGALVAAGALLWRGRRRRRRPGATAVAAPPFEAWWLCACLLVPPAVYLASVLPSHFNLGVRHVFPVYGPLFVAAGVAAARAWASARAAWPRRTAAVAAVLAAGLAAESLAAYPDYIPFFNAAAGGARGGFAILGDSNLDWGQDLPLLADWQRAHPGRTLYLAYNGTTDPRAYGIRYLPLTIGNDFTVTRRVFPTSGVVAASATMLQTNWSRPEAQAFFHGLRGLPPVAVLGGSIYVYDLGGE